MDELKTVNEDNCDLELLQEELEYLQLKENFFEDQTDLWGKLINNQELKVKESLKEEQKLIEKLNEKKIEKEMLISHLKSLKDQIKASKKKSLNNFESVIIRIDGFLHCHECNYKANRRWHLKSHINAVHRKLKPHECANCGKGWLTYQIIFNQYIYKIYFI